jgi:hypothetical protein
MMKASPRGRGFAFTPALFLPLLFGLVALACSDTKPQPTLAPKYSTAPWEARGTPSTPQATHVVYSPLVGSGGTPNAPVNPPEVEIAINPTTLKVNEKVTVTARSGDLESPTYYLFIIDSGSAETAYMVGVSAGNEIIPGTNTSQVLALDSVILSSEQAVFTLHAMAKGMTEVWVSAVSGGTTTGGTVAGGVSQNLQVTVKK